MTAAAVSDRSAVSAKRQGRAGRRDWGRALGALRQLFADKEDTSQVFEIMRALNGPSAGKGYYRLLQTPAGGRLAYQRDELTPKPIDHASLAALTPSTLGAAQRDILPRQQLSAAGLVASSTED